MILLIDNFDSFVFNLARYLRELGQETVVVRNDRLRLSDVATLQPEAVVLSPGPCTPDDAGICVEFIRRFGDALPMLGVCLGHQAIAAAFGGRVIRAEEPVHGRTSMIHHDGSKLFAGLPNPFAAARYHSLVIEEPTLPSEVRVTARTADGVPMAIHHRRWPLFGVQFHPESVLTVGGKLLLQNFLRIAGVDCSTDAPPTSTEYLPDPQPPAAPLPAVLHW